MKNSQKDIEYEWITQRHLVSCGAAVSAEILWILWEKVSQEETERDTILYGKAKWLTKLLTKEWKFDAINKKYRSILWTSLDAIADTINKYIDRFQASVKTECTRDDIKSSIDKDMPVACLVLWEWWANPHDPNKGLNKWVFGRHYIVIVWYTDEWVIVRNPLGFEQKVERREFMKRRWLNYKYLSMHKPESRIKEYIKDKVFLRHQKWTEYIIKKYNIPEEKQTNAMLENLIIREFMKPRSAVFLEPKNKGE